MNKFAITGLSAASILFAMQANAQSTSDIPRRLCADVNGDGSVTPADFNAWVVAFNANDPRADQNQDGAVTPADFNAFIINQNLGNSGPFCPRYSAGCPGTGLFVAEDFIASNPSTPIDLSSIDSVPTGFVTTDRGSIIDAEVFIADGIANLVLENRLVAGDDPAENPPAGEVDRVREERSLAALHILDENGNDNFVSALITRSSWTRVDDTTGATISSRVDLYDRVEVIGRYQTFALALSGTMELSAAVDLEIEDPVFGGPFNRLPERSDRIFDLDTGVPTIASGSRQIDCTSPTLTCEQDAGCWYDDCYNDCLDQLDADLINDGITGGITTAAGCGIGAGICALIPGAQPFIPVCCVIGAGYSGIPTTVGMLNSSFTKANGCGNSCERDFQRDLQNCP